MTDTHAAMTTPASDDPFIIAPNYDPRCSKTQKSIYPALFALQNELDPITKTEKNQHLRATYADLKAVWAAIREPLKENGLLVLQEPHPHPEGAMVTTTVVHVESGEWRRSTLFVPSLVQFQKSTNSSEYTAQGHGSALTYCRKYSLLTVLGLCTEDDDGHAATVSSQPAARTPGPAEYHQANVDDADTKGWEAWGARQMLQLQGCADEPALIACWNGMQAELKKAPAEVRAGMMSMKDQCKVKFAAGGAAGPDVPF